MNLRLYYTKQLKKQLILNIQSQRMGKYMTEIRHSGVAGTTINIIHVLVTISRQAQ